MKFLWLILMPLVLNLCNQICMADALIEKFPYARLNSDFGILNEHDLKKSGEEAFAAPFTVDSHSYPYWKCYPTSKMRFSCAPADEDHGELFATLMIWIGDSAGYDEYEGRRAVDLSTCKDHLRRWRALSSGEKYACIAGRYVGSEEKVLATTKKGGGRLLHGDGWIYDRFKTKKGCTSYFDDDC